MVFDLKLQKYEQFILIWLLFYVLLQFRTHIFTTESKYLIIGLVAIDLLLRIILIHKKGRTISEVLLLLFRIFLVALILATSCIGSKQYLFVNMREIMIPMILIIFMGNILNDTQGLDTFFRRILLPLNIYLLINSVILLMQINGSEILIDRTFYSELSYDYISGFFGGTDGAHRLTFFSAFVTLLNMYYLPSEKILQRRICWGIYLCGILLTTYGSTQNDNVSYFVFLPISILVYYIVKSNKIVDFVKRHYKVFIFISIIIVAGLFIFKDTSLFIKIINRFNNTVMTYNIYGTNESRIIDERALLLEIAINRGGVFGEGIGSIKLLNERSITTSFGLHFGMASIQSLVYMIGVIGYILYCGCIAFDFARDSRRKIVSMICIIVYVVLSSYYSQVLTVFNSSILFLFTLLLIGRIGKNADVNETKAERE